MLNFVPRIIMYGLWSTSSILFRPAASAPITQKVFRSGPEVVRMLYPSLFSVFECRVPAARILFRTVVLEIWDRTIHVPFSILSNSFSGDFLTSKPFARSAFIISSKAKAAW